MKYRIKDATNRANIDLTQKNISNAIIKGVKNVFPNAKVNIKSKHFEVLNVTNPSNTDLREMGTEIVHKSNNLMNISKKYNYRKSNGSKGVSKQVFRRFN